jgi:predicted  nucleic acid-binding Zn-ribbon protein
MRRDEVIERDLLKADLTELRALRNDLEKVNTNGFTVGLRLEQMEAYVRKFKQDMSAINQHI